MVSYQLEDIRGFQVVHESTGWRTAVHSYERGVNDAESLESWGIHLDSEEAFVLLCGTAVLAVDHGADSVEIVNMEPFHQYVVGAAERHAIALAEGSRVLIMENQDMSRFSAEKMDPNIAETIKTLIL